MSNKTFVTTGISMRERIKQSSDLLKHEHKQHPVAWTNDGNYWYFYKTNKQ